MTFILDNTDLQNTDLYDSIYLGEKCVLAESGTSLNGVNATFKIVYANDDTSITEEVAVSSGAITIDAPEKVRNIIVGGVTYTLATSATPTNTEFVISSNNQVTIPSLVTQPDLSSAVVIRQGDSLKTLKLDQIPAVLYRLPIIGNLSIQDSFQNSPSCQLTLITTQQHLPTFRVVLQAGKQLDIFNFGFTIESYTENIIKDTKQVTVSVNLRGKWDDFLSFPIPLKNTTLTSGTDVPFTDADCIISVDNPLTNFSDESGQALTDATISIQELASRIGATYKGIDGSVDIPRGTDFNATTTLSNEIQKLTDINSSFIYLSDTDAIKTKTFASANEWIYKETDLLEDVTTSISRRPPVPAINQTYDNLITKSLVSNSPISSIQADSFLSYTEENTANISIPTYQNITFPDDFDERRELKRLKEPTTVGEPIFKLRKPVVTTRVTGDEDANLAPNHITRLKDLTYNYDAGGVTKTRTTTTEIDGSVVREVVERFGFAYTTTSLGIVNESDPNNPVIDGSPSSHWQLIELLYTTHLYDEKTGYYLGFNQSGRRYLRLAQEQADFGVSNNSRWKIQQDTDDLLNTATPFQIATHRNYGFRWVNYYGSKRFLLAQHRDYYKDFDVPSQYEIFKVCNRDGTSTYRYKLDPNYVEPMFVLQESQEQHCFAIGTNPNNFLRGEGDPILPPISAGVESFNRTKIEINASKNTIFGDSSTREKEDSYYTYTSNFSAQEVGFGTVVEQTEISLSTGVPGVHTRRAPKYELVNTEEEDERNRQINNRKRFQYVVWTEPFNGGFPRTGTLDFEKAFTFEEAITGAITRLKIEDLRNTLTTTTSIPVNLEIKSGDIITLYVGGTIYRRRVISLNHEITFQGEQLITATTKLTLGIDRDIASLVKFKREEIPDPRQHLIITTIYDRDLRLGGIVSNRMKNRGNYSTYNG